MSESQDSWGLFRIEFYIPATGEIINLGSINTESGRYGLHEETEIIPVLNELGFASASDFAKSFNEKFSHRTDDSKTKLIEGGAYVDQMLRQQEDILIGDEKFKNFRLAVLIWVAAQALEQPIEDTVEIAGITLDLVKIKDKLPNLDIRDVLVHPSDAIALKYIEEYLPSEASEVPEGSLSLENTDQIINLLKPYIVEKAAFDTNQHARFESLLYSNLSIPNGAVLGPVFKAMVETKHSQVADELHKFFYGFGEYGEKIAEIEDWLFATLAGEDNEDWLKFALQAYEYRGG